jgi:hypothetical protein
LQLYWRVPSLLLKDCVQLTANKRC